MDVIRRNVWAGSPMQLADHRALARYSPPGHLIRPCHSLFVVAILVAVATAAAPLRAQDLPTPAPWITDEAPFLEMCTHDTLLRVLRFADASACESAVRASASHCNKVLTEDFAGKPEAAPETASRRAFLRGAGQGCFMAQMDGRTDGRFVPVLQHLAKAAREGRKPQD